MNAHFPIVIVASITSKGTERAYPFNVLVEPPDGGLSLRSKVMLTQLRSMNKTRLLTYYGRFSGLTMPPSA